MLKRIVCGGCNASFMAENPEDWKCPVCGQNNGTPAAQVPDTGAGVKHDTGKAPLSLLPTRPLTDVARVLEFGMRKYGRDNWRKGMQWTRLIDASLRHLMAYKEREDKDPETGLSHLAHAACGLLFLLEYERTHKDKDDRSEVA
jgi:hypothetical protein